MATGLVHRYKGKIQADMIMVGSGGIKQGTGTPSSSRAVFTNAGAPTNGTSGTLANICAKGDLLVDTTNTVTYLNTGTAASPLWSAVALTRTIAAGLTAAGTNRATALVLTADISEVATAAASTGVVLPAATVGLSKTIYHNGASAITVYADGTDTIDGTAGATGVALTNAKRCEYRCLVAGKWVSAQLGAVSA